MDSLTGSFLSEWQTVVIPSLAVAMLSLGTLMVGLSFLVKIAIRAIKGS